MRDALERVLNWVGKVVHRVDAPLVALPVMVHVADAVDDGVAHVEVSAREVNFRAQRLRALGELAGSHARKQIEVFLDRAVAVRRDGGLSDVAAVLAELLRRQIADVGKALFDELDGVFIVLFKIVRAIEEPVSPVKAQPVNIGLDRVDILCVFLRGVRVVHAQVAQAAEFFRRSEIDRERLAVADVQISVRLGREAGMDLQPFKLTAGGNILFNESVDKVSRLQGLSFFFHVIHPLLCVLILCIIYDFTPQRNGEFFFRFNI